MNYKTEKFGIISLNENSIREECRINYMNQKINLEFTEFNIYGDKTQFMLEIITILNKYDELNKIAKSAIIENYSKNEQIKGYFNGHFDFFNNEKQILIFGEKMYSSIDIVENILENTENIILQFGLNRPMYELYISIDYHIFKEVSNYLLGVYMQHIDGIFKINSIYICSR